MITEKVDVLNPSFKKEYLDLWKTCFGNLTKGCIEWYDWLNLKCPEGKNNSFIIRDENNTPISGYGLLPLIVIHNNQKHRSTLCTNVMTHPDHGGKGLFTRIGADSLQVMKNLGATIQLGIPNDNAIKGHMKVGWQRMPDLVFYEKSKDYTETQDINYNIIDKFDPSHDLRIQEFHNKYNFYVRKDHELLNWRFVNHPLNSYKCIILEPFNGYIIIKPFTEENKTKIHIVDYAYDTISDLENLLNIVNNFAIDLKAELINLWRLVGNSEESSIFTSHNYNRTENSNKLILYSDINFDNEDVSKWHIVLGDNDVY
jgi:hypothetical protein